MNQCLLREQGRTRKLLEQGSYKGFYKMQINSMPSIKATKKKTWKKQSYIPGNFKV